MTNTTRTAALTKAEPGKHELVPKFLRASLYAIMLVAAIVSVPFLGAYGPLPTTVLLDAWIVVFVLTMFLSRRLVAPLIFLCLSAYGLTRLVPALAIQAPLEDFFQAYRWLLYLVAFTFALGKMWTPVRLLVKVTWCLLILALVKAAATFVALGPGERPGLLLENNFELALFAGLVAILYRDHLGRSRVAAVVALGALTFLSGSRSGAIAFLILALYAVTQSKVKNLFVQYLMGLGIIALSLFPIAIFAERASQSASIDRLNFLNVFLADTEAWSPMTWLFGTVPITPLSPGACDDLSYYERLFSSTGDGSCYSVILHAFVMRVVYDAGIVGLLIAFGITWYVMRRAGIRFTLSATLLLIALTNSMSVSGLNNPYVALPILLALLTVTSPIDTVGSKREAKRATRTKPRGRTHR
jgi:hypothetical protein